MVIKLKINKARMGKKIQHIGRCVKIEDGIILLQRTGMFSPTIHPTDASDLASHATVDILTTATESSPIASAKLQWAHCSLNALSWVFR